MKTKAWIGWEALAFCHPSSSSRYSIIYRWMTFAVRRRPNYASARHSVTSRLHWSVEVSLSRQEISGTSHYQETRKIFHNAARSMERGLCPSQLRHLDLDLVALESLQPWLLSDPKITAFDLRDKWISQFKSLAAWLPNCFNLETFSLKASRKGPFFGFPNGHPAFVSSKSIITVLHAISGVGRGGGCFKLKQLELDTQDAELSSWSIATGVGASCDAHVCPVIAETIARLPCLKVVKLGRRDMCAELLRFDRYLPSTTRTDVLSTAAHPTLETLVLNFRLIENQVVNSSIYEARPRPCKCACRCASCLAHLEADRAVEDARIANDIPAHTANYFKYISTSKGTPLPTEAPAPLWSYNDPILGRLGHTNASYALALSMPWPGGFPARHTHLPGSASSNARVPNDFSDPDEGGIAHLNSILHTAGELVRRGALPAIKSIVVLSHGRPSATFDNAYRERKVWSVLDMVVTDG